jgi:hypothetical protein
MGPRGGALVLGDCFAPATQVRRLRPARLVACCSAGVIDQVLTGNLGEDNRQPA